MSFSYLLSFFKNTRVLTFFALTSFLVFSLVDRGHADFYGEHEIGLQPFASDRYGASYYVPADFTPEQDWPLVIVLYSDEAGKGAQFVKAWLSEIGKRHVIVLFVSYLAPRNVPFSSDERILRLKKELMEKYPINPNRIWLTAYGAAAHYAFYLGACYPEHFSAVALAAGGAQGRFEPFFVYHRKNIEKIAFLILYGSNDPSIQKNVFVNKHHALVKRGFQIEMEEYDQVGHQFLPEFRTKIMDWFQNFPLATRERIEEVEAEKISSISFGIPKFVFSVVRGIMKS